jgi:ubiquinone/menaquinone biosynthesis C-methylase UbiE
MPERPEFGPTYHEKGSLRLKILNALAELGIVDRIAQKRAIDIVEKSKVREHLKPGGVYLDIGTAIGHIVERIVKEEESKDVKFLAVEPIWKPLKKVRERLKETGKVGFAKAVGEALPVKDKSVDGISLFVVLHHVNPEIREKIFQEVDRVMKDDGLLFLVEDTPDNEEEKARNSKWDQRINFEPKNTKHYYLSDAEWIKFLDEHGWELVDYSYFEEDPPPREGLMRHGSYILRRKREQKTS